MEHQRTSYAFLMEMICVCALFLVCAGIFVSIFVKSETISRQADLLNQAVLTAENAMEMSFSLKKAADEKSFATDELTVSIDTDEKDGLMNVTVQVFDTDHGNLIYTLTGARAVSEGGTV